MDREAWWAIVQRVKYDWAHTHTHPQESIAEDQDWDQWMENYEKERLYIREVSAPLLPHRILVEDRLGLSDFVWGMVENEEPDWTLRVIKYQG